MGKPMILITGGSGQIGTALIEALTDRYGKDRVLATDIKEPETGSFRFKMMDILNVQRMREVIDENKITQIYHLAAILSASGEWNPMKTWNVNLNGLLSILEIAREFKLGRIFYPSTIAVFGKTTPREHTPQDSPLQPTTVYGISKLAGELWVNYYHLKYGIDVRSVRFPGIIGHESLPGGGTTDYAVEIFFEALKNGSYQCFLREDTTLPMLYMPDAIRGTIELMEASPSQLTVRTSYNLSGMSFSPAELAKEIRKHIPNFTITYAPDFRQAIADSWTQSIDDHQARKDWGWKPEYDLERMTEDMIAHIRKRY